MSLNNAFRKGEIKESDVETCLPRKCLSLIRHYSCISIPIIFLANLFLFLALDYLINFRMKKIQDISDHELVVTSREIINKVLLNDIETLFNDLRGTQISWLLLKKDLHSNEASHQKYREQKLIVESSYIKTLHTGSIWEIDLKDLRELLDRYLSETINYEIILDSTIIAKSNNSYANYIYEKEISISNNSFLIKLGIDPLSNQFVLSNKQKDSLKKEIKTCVVSLMLLLDALLILFLIRSKKRLLGANLKYTNILEKYNNLLLSQSIEEKFKNIFTQKFTNMLVNNLHGSLETSNLEKIKYTDEVIPFVLKDTASVFIEPNGTRSIFDNLTKYYSDKILINSTCHNTDLQISCGKEVFYQLTVSIIHNLANFLADQSDQKKTVTINFTGGLLEIIFEGASLNKNNLLKISHELFANNSELFLLSFRKIFISLEEHDLGYKIIPNFNCNKIVINFCNQQKVEKIGNIIKFRKQADSSEIS